MLRKTLRLVRVLCAFGVLLLSSHLIHPTFSEAATYYVATTGSDHNVGTFSEPFQTLQKAVGVIHAGDTVQVRAGRYPAFELRDSDGTPNARITFQPYQDERVVIDRHLGGGNGYRAIEFHGGSYITIAGFIVTDSDPRIDLHADCDVTNQLQRCHEILQKTFHGRNGIKLNRSGDSPHHIVLNNLEIVHNAGQAILGNGVHFEILDNHIHHNGTIGEGYGMYLSGEGHLIRGNRCHDNNGHGIRLGNFTHPLTDSVIEQNTTYDNVQPFIHYRNHTEPVLERTGAGITLWGGERNLFRNNLVFGNGGFGIRIAGAHNMIFNNTVYKNGLRHPIQGGGEGIFDQFDEAGNIFRNNISFGSGSQDAHIEPGSTDSHNLFGIDPQFVNPAKNNFRLRPGSPAIDAGMPLSDVRHDFEKSKRGQAGHASVDIGAYELQVP